LLIYRGYTSDSDSDVWYWERRRAHRTQRFHRGATRWQLWIQAVGRLCIAHGAPERVRDLIWEFMANMNYVDEKEYRLCRVRRHAEALSKPRCKACGFIADKEVVFAAMTRSGAALKHAAEHLRADWDVVLMAVSTCGAALEHAAEPLRADRGLVLTACGGPNRSQWALRWAAPHLQDDQEFVALCIEGSRGWALIGASARLQADRKLLLAAVVQDGSLLHFLPHEAAADREVVLTAVRQNGQALCSAAWELRGDKEVVLAAVAQDGRALAYTWGGVRRDREVLRTALAQDGRAIAYVGEELRLDRELVLAAVTQDGRALEHVAHQLRGDAEVVRTAVAQNQDAVVYALEPAVCRACLRVGACHCGRRWAAMTTAMLETLTYHRDFVP